MNPVNKTRVLNVPNVPIITKPEKLHAKGFISDAQLHAALAKDGEKLGKADDEVLAIYTLEAYSAQNPMTSNQTDAIKSARGLASRQKPSNDEKLSKEQKEANAKLVTRLEDGHYRVVKGLPGKDGCMIFSALKTFANEKQPDLPTLYKAHQQCSGLICPDTSIGGQSTIRGDLHDKATPQFRSWL